jgi:cobalamin biosynthesis protein CobD/CbiB
VNALERFLLWAGAIGTFATGAAYGWMKYFLTTDDPYAVVNHPLQPAMLKLHILFAPLLVFSIGLVFTQHIWRRWRAGRRSGRISGLTTLLTVVPMIASGYLIQTVTGGGLLTWLVWIHVVTGALYFVMFSSHRTLMRIRERRRELEAARRLRLIETDGDEHVA